MRQFPQLNRQFDLLILNSTIYNNIVTKAS